MNKQNNTAEKSSISSRKLYKQPKLICLGAITSVTLKSGTASDNQNHPTKK